MKKPTLMGNDAEELREELNRLQQEESPRAAQAIRDAQDSPDFQQGAEYAQALERQTLIEHRIAELKRKLSGAQAHDEAVPGDSRVALGASVTLRPEPEGEPVRYRIVGADEADIASGKLSVAAPLARALLGREAGDLVTVEAPGGTRNFRILEVAYGQ